MLKAEVIAISGKTDGQKYGRASPFTDS